MELREYLVAEACNNAWANLRLWTACAGLDRAALEAPRTGFFPSIASTLDHLYGVDALYVDALERAHRGEPPHPEPGQLFRVRATFEGQRAMDRRGIAVTREVALDLPVGIVRRSGVQHEQAVRILGHLFQHQIHHRGQVHAMLSGTAVPPPQLDEFWCANEAHLRAAELAELGLSEEEVWHAAAPPAAAR